MALFYVQLKWEKKCLIICTCSYSADTIKTCSLCYYTGQVIKQKRGVDGKGQCYGWTKEGIMGKKTFGYYKPGMVRPMKSNK